MSQQSQTARSAFKLALLTPTCAHQHPDSSALRLRIKRNCYKSLPQVVICSLCTTTYCGAVPLLLALLVSHYVPRCALRTCSELHLILVWVSRGLGVYQQARFLIVSKLIDMHTLVQLGRKITLLLTDEDASTSETCTYATSAVIMHN
jgi:hypothetical protein